MMPQEREISKGKTESGERCQTDDRIVFGRWTLEPKALVVCGVVLDDFLELKIFDVYNNSYFIGQGTTRTFFLFRPGQQTLTIKTIIDNVSISAPDEIGNRTAEITATANKEDLKVGDQPVTIVEDIVRELMKEIAWDRYLADVVSQCRTSPFDDSKIDEPFNTFRIDAMTSKDLADIVEKLDELLAEHYSRKRRGKRAQNTLESQNNG